MMNPQDMTILVAAIFRGSYPGWDSERCVDEAKEFVRVAEKKLLKDRATRERQVVSDAAAVLAEGERE